MQGRGGGPIENMGGRGVAHSAPASTKPSAAPVMTVDVMRVNAYARCTHIHTVSDIHHLCLNDLSASEWAHVVEQPQMTC